MTQEINLFELSWEAPPQPNKQTPPQTPQESSEERALKQVIEALLFASSEPLAFQKLMSILRSTLPCKPKKVRQLLRELQKEYLMQKRAFQLEEIAEGFVIRTRKQFAPYVELLHVSKKKERISQACSEVLAIIAYKQPITRAIIDDIRGVDSSGALHTLMERELIEISGKLEAPGRPSLYVTTKKFLENFGLHSLEELHCLPSTEEANEETEGAPEAPPSLNSDQ